VDGIHYIAITEFDASGRRASDKQIKTNASARNVPLHPRLIELGFLEFVHGRNSRRLFDELRRAANGGYSHEASKWFGAFLDKIGLIDPALVFHSFRHGFRDACRMAGLSEEVTNALGGWAATSVGQKYGDRGMLPLLDREIRRIEFVRF
jgi:integrase